MKKMKKLLAVLLSLCMILSLCSMGVVADTVTTIEVSGDIEDGLTVKVNNVEVTAGTDEFGKPLYGVEDGDWELDWHPDGTPDVWALLWLRNGSYTVSIDKALAEPFGVIVLENAELYGNEFFCNVENYGEIRGGTYHAQVLSEGDIHEGTFNDMVRFESGGEKLGGTYNSYVVIAGEGEEDDTVIPPVTEGNAYQANVTIEEGQTPYFEVRIKWVGDNTTIRPNMASDPLNLKAMSGLEEGYPKVDPITGEWVYRFVSIDGNLPMLYYSATPPSGYDIMEPDGSVTNTLTLTYKGDDNNNNNNNNNNDLTPPLDIEDEDEGETVSVRIKFDGVDEDEIDDLTVNLLKDGKKKDSEKLSEKDNWHHRWEGLSDDEDIDWGVELKEIPEGCEAEVVRVRGNYFEIILSKEAVEAPSTMGKPNPGTGAGFLAWIYDLIF